MRGRQIIGPRRVAIVALVDDGSGRNLPVVDDAVDLRAMDIGGYWDSLFAADKLSLKQSEQPSWFTIRPLTMAQKLAAPPRAVLFLRAGWLVRCGLVRIENYPLQQPDGGELQAPQPDPKTHGKLGDIATEEWLTECGLSEQDILALGAMIEHISEASHPLSRPSGAPRGPGVAETTAKVPA